MWRRACPSPLLWPLFPISPFPPSSPRTPRISPTLLTLPGLHPPHRRPPHHPPTPSPSPASVIGPLFLRTPHPPPSPTALGHRPPAPHVSAPSRKECEALAHSFIACPHAASYTGTGVRTVLRESSRRRSPVASPSPRRSRKKGFNPLVPFGKDWTR